MWKSWYVYHVFHHCCIPFINFLDLMFQINSFTRCLMWKSCSFVFWCTFWFSWNFDVREWKIMISMFVPLEMAFIMLPNFLLVSFSVIKEHGQVFFVEIDCLKYRTLFCSSANQTVRQQFYIYFRCLYLVSFELPLHATWENFYQHFPFPCFVVDLICNVTATFLAILYSTKYCSMCNTFCGKFGS